MRTLCPAAGSHLGQGLSFLALPAGAVGQPLPEVLRPAGGPLRWLPAPPDRRPAKCPPDLHPAVTVPVARPTYGARLRAFATALTYSWGSISLVHHFGRSV